MTYEEFIQTALTQASKITSDNFGKISSTTKAYDNNQVLTDTDITIGKLLVSSVKKAYPNHNIIEEETGAVNNSSEYTWTIDPIDGTSNFAGGIPMYGIMIGLLQEGIPIAGGIALPYFSEYLIATKGKGTFCNGEKLSVTQETDLLKTLIAYGIDGQQNNPEFTREEAKIIGEIVLNIRNLRSSNSCFDAVQVAKGKYGGWLTKISRIWDLVPMQIITEEAGGIFTDFLGKPMDYSNPLTKVEVNFTVCAASSSLHKQLLGIITTVS